MHNHRLVLLGIAAALVGMAFAVSGRAAPGPLGPAFRGKPFRFWVESLRERDPKRRIKAINTLAVIGPPARAAVPALLEALKDDNADVRNAAAEALLEIAPGAPEVRDALARGLKDPYLYSRASVALCRGGEAGLAVLKEAYRTGGADLRNSITAALLHSPPNPAALPILIAALQDREADARRSAIRAVARLGPRARTAVPALQALIKVDDDYIPSEAASALIEVAEPPVAVEALLALLNGDGRHSRRDAANLLGRMGPRARAAVPALRAVLDNEKSSEMREGAALALWRIDRQKSAIRAFVSAIRDSEDAFDALVIIEELRELATEEAATATLVEILSSPSEKWLKEPGVATSLIEQIRPPAAAAAPLVVKDLRNESSEVREAAARTLGVIGADNPQVIAALRQTLRDKNQFVRRTAARALVLLGAPSPAVVSVLREMLDTEDGRECDQTAWLLWQVERKPNALVPVLIQQLTEDDDADEDQVFAMVILGEIGPMRGRPSPLCARRYVIGQTAFAARPPMPWDASAVLWRMSCQICWRPRRTTIRCSAWRRFVPWAHGARPHDRRCPSSPDGCTTRTCSSAVPRKAPGPASIPPRYGCRPSLR